jgi:hypothetical protein
MQPLEIFFRKHLSAFERLTNIRTLFVALLLAIVGTTFLFLNSSIFNYLIVDPVHPLVPPSASSAEVIEAGLFVEDFLRFDMTENVFVFEGILWFRSDTTLPDTIGRFSFARGELTEQILMEETPSSRRYKIKVELQGDLDFRFFPLDDHRLDIVLQNQALREDDAVFAATARDLSLSLAISEGDRSWQLQETSVQAGVARFQLGDSRLSTPEVVFSESPDIKVDRSYTFRKSRWR